MIAFGGRLDRYLLKRTILITVMVMVLMVVVTMSIDFLINIGTLKSSHPKAGILVISLYWYKLPQLANLALPVSSVIAALLVCAPMLKRGEFIALASTGISPARVGLMIPIIALAIGVLDAYIADRITPRATIRTTYIQDQLQSQSRLGRVWQVPSTKSSWFIAHAGGLISGSVPTVDKVVIASPNGLVMADEMRWADQQWQLRGHLLEFRVNGDGTCALYRPTEIPLEGDLALPYNPLKLYARLLPRDTQTSAELLRLGDTSDTAYAWSRWARCCYPFLAVLVALPMFVRFLHRDNLILGVARSLGAAALPVGVVMVGTMVAETAHPQLVIIIAVVVAVIPSLIFYFRWRL